MIRAGARVFKTGPNGLCPTGLNGWLENLIADHAAGDSVETLAERRRLPAGHIRATLNEPPEASAADAPQEAEA